MKNYLTIACIFLIIMVMNGRHLDTIPLTQQIGKVTNTWDEFYQTSPSAGIPLLEVPKPNFNGNTNLSVPIKLPEARKGFSPVLSINYNNEGGSTWLGTGWDLSLSAINLDTRWGVPLFFSSTESEIYLFDGEQMGPVFHREKTYDRVADRTFHLRQEQDFHRIKRHGDSPKNYWWSVEHKDGSKHYYGGSPESGYSAAHTLTTPTGNITYWALSKSTDIYSNLIAYTYQKVQRDGGVDIYPLSITYNGLEGNEGDYKVDFNLRSSPRGDISISMRTGMKLVSADLLDNIVVTYKEEVIRSYKMNYKAGAFEKTLLTDVAEYNQVGDLFYQFDFDYFDDIRTGGVYNAYGPSRQWNVPKDNIPSGSFAATVNGFKSKPTILGGAQSQSEGGGLAITVGPPFNPVSKDYSAGPNSTISNTDSQGLTALIDINGDGLPDKVFRLADGLYFRPNLFNGDNPIEGFGISRKVEGIKEFSVANNFSWTIGAELTVPPLFAGYFHEEGTTTISTYFADFNGDELIDIAHRGQVYFNHISPTGIPTFTLFSHDTPSIIYKGEESTNEPPTAEEIANLQKRNPLHDVVRIWKAPFSGRISIEGAVSLQEDTSDEAQAYEYGDGVFVSIETDSLHVWTQFIDARDFTPKQPQNVSNINVRSGQKVYFRVNSINDGKYDVVEWNPRISYLNKDLSSIDANCLPIYSYDSQEDFIVSDRKEIYLPSDGRIKIFGDFSKPILTDTIHVSISGAFDTILSIPPSEVINQDLLLNNLPVTNGQNLSFSIYSESNVDWASIHWQPRVEYESFDDGSDVIGPDGKPVVSFCPVVHKDGYFNLISPGAPFVAQEEGTLEVELEFNSFVQFIDNSITLKIKGKPDSIRYSIDSLDLIGNGSFYASFNHNVELGDSIYLDIHVQDPNNLLFSLPIRSEIKLNNNTNILIPVIHSKHKGGANTDEGHLYRGWGQFVYNPVGDIPFAPIDLSKAMVDTTNLSGDTTLVDEGTNTGDLEGTNVNLESKFTVMTSDPKSPAWQGSDRFAYLDGTTIGATRFGRKNISAFTQNGATVSSPDLISKTRGDAGMGGLGIGPAEGSAGYAGVTTWSVKDIGDMNGDRYPDIINENRIVYTNFRGSLTSVDFDHNWGTHEVWSEAWVLGAGRNFPSSGAKNAGSSPGKGSNKSSVRGKSKAKSSMNKSRSATKSARNSVGINGSLSGDKDNATHTFLDINGDGLEDKVWDDGRVALSHGITFGSIENWGFDGINSGDAFDAGAGLGISISNGSYQAGTSVTKTNNQSQMGFVDLNDDALVDQVISTNPVMVRINTGSGFTAPILWLNETDIDEGVSIGESVNGAITVCLEFLFFRVCFNPSTFAGQGTSGIYTAFQDINGDGYPDFLRAEGDDANLKVNNSTIGKTNFLKSVSMPLNGSMEFDYAFEGNTYDLPFSKWVLSEVTTKDGLSGDGISTYKRAFAYDEGMYDRHERQFYGFGKVREDQLDGNEVVRVIETDWDVSSYYTKGLNTRQTILDGNGVKAKEIINTYVLKDITSGDDLPDAIKVRDDIEAAPTLAQTMTTFYNGDPVGINQIQTFAYDTFWNVIEIVDEDQAGYTRTKEFTYLIDEDQYFLDKITSERISVNGQLYRQTDYTLDNKGNQIQINKLIKAGLFATTDMTYDNYGNLRSVEKPANHRGQRMSYEFEYDSEQHQYMVKEKDIFEYQKSYTHDYKYNQLVSYISINGNETTYEYDNYGRQASITFPYEKEADLPYSVRHSYFPNAAVGYSISDHYDPANQSDLSIVNFEDGLHRAVQDKKLASIHINGTQAQARYIVSGTDIYDGLGRQVENFLPLEENIGSEGLFNSLPNTITPINTTFDILDRPVSIIDTYGNKTEIVYSIEENQNGQRKLTTKSIDPIGHTITKYFNTRGDLMSIQTDGPDGAIWTHYIRDGYSQVTKIIDPYGNETDYSYDFLGRRLSVKVPDTGLTELYYDDANNLIERVTATIRDVISEDGSIRYSYDYERLIQIDYPKHFQNKVQIHYGAATDSFNRAGRIWLQEDATGGREYFFDANGNPTKTIRTAMINRSKVFTFVTQATYDTWGRVVTMSYPDGEAVDYQYDLGGRLQSMKGTKGDDVYKYLGFAGYDRYEDRVFIQYGNEVEDQFSYDNKGRLVDRITSLESQQYTDETYTYNEVDLVKTKTNFGLGDEELGGIVQEEFVYDPLRRLSSASGNWVGQDSQRYSLFFDYNDLNDLTMKGQEHLINGQPQILNTRTFDYAYENAEKPTRPSEVGGKNYHYDSNGNVLLNNSQAIFSFDQHIYDEENRMIGSSDNGYKSRYTYDAFGLRTLKSHGESQGTFVNGAPAGFLEHKENFQVEVSPYFTVYEHEYRKHYFIDDSRVLTKIGTGLFQTGLGQGPEITAGGIDYKSRIHQYEQSILDYYGGLGVAPGPPSLLALLGQPELNDISLPDATNSNPYNTPPPAWPNIAPPDTTGPPGPPIFYEFANIDNTNVEAGYNFTSGQITKELECFYYHYDFTNSTQYVTDYAGKPRQYAMYLPSGERWIYQQRTRDASNYFFNGLTLDNETGMYNLGDIYYDPITNVEQSMDNILQNFGQSTFEKRLEGDFYYEYADIETLTGFDNEILNSEKPNPFLAKAIEPVTEKFDDEDGYIIDLKHISLFKKKKTLNTTQQKKDVINELGDLSSQFQKQDKASPTEFYYSDFNSFFKYKNEEKKYKKKQKAKLNKRKKNQKSKRKVRFK